MTDRPRGTRPPTLRRTVFRLVAIVAVVTTLIWSALGYSTANRPSSVRSSDVIKSVSVGDQNGRSVQTLAPVTTRTS